MRVAFFEDSSVANFHPITLARPVFELTCGRFGLRERVVRHCGVTEWGVFVREHLAETYKEAHPEAHVNDLVWLSRAATVVINGRWLPSSDALVNNLDQDGTALVDGRVAFATLEPFDAALVMRNGWEPTLSQLAQSRRAIEATGCFLEFPWDLVRHNASQLREDFRLASASAHRIETGPQIGILGATSDFDIDPSARLEPFVVLDASQGPISVGAGAVLKPFTHVSGPCHIDRGSQVFGATIRGGTTIGPNCRAGGEIESTILESHVNKYHAGFLGHSYVCPWANLGALTTNSDLKNDYSHVRVPIGGESVDTGLVKVGSFIADHAKTSIGSLLNTGASIGAMSMILPDGKLSPKHVPSFCKVQHGELTDGIDLEQALRAARVAMGRRNCELTPAQERLWRRLYVQTRVERENAILRFRERDFSREATSPH